MTEKLYRVEEAAELLAVSVRTVWRLISAGELVVKKVRRCTRVTAASVAQFIERSGVAHGSGV